MSLCLRCGNWKQAPARKCRCGFAPARGSLDEAKSFVLSTQFRSAESLAECARAIRAGEAVSFAEAELKLAQRIGTWNAVVSSSFLVSANFLGLLVVPFIIPLSWWTILGFVAGAAMSLAFAFGLMSHVEREVQAVSTRRAPKA